MQVWLSCLPIKALIQRRPADACSMLIDQGKERNGVISIITSSAYIFKMNDFALSVRVIWKSNVTLCVLSFDLFSHKLKLSDHKPQKCTVEVGMQI